MYIRRQNDSIKEKGEHVQGLRNVTNISDVTSVG